MALKGYIPRLRHRRIKSKLHIDYAGGSVMQVSKWHRRVAISPCSTIDLELWQPRANASHRSPPLKLTRSLEQQISGQVAFSKKGRKRPPKIETLLKPEVGKGRMIPHLSWKWSGTQPSSRIKRALVPRDLAAHRFPLSEEMYGWNLARPCAAS